MNKKVPLWLVLLFLWIGCIMTIGFGAAVLNISSNDRVRLDKKSRIILTIAAIPHLVKKSFDEIFAKSPLLAPVRYPGITGLKPEKKYIDSNYLLLATYDSNRGQAVAKLIRLSDQKVLHQWLQNFDQTKQLLRDKSDFWKISDKQSTRLFNPLILNDGSIVFNNFYSPLIKMDKNSKLVWVINGTFHHSIECDADGNTWAPSIIENSKFLKNMLPAFVDNAITKVSPNGKVLFKKSVAEILIENGYRGLLLGVGNYEIDLSHLNDIQPALTTTKHWMKGDLLISLRNRSTVFLYRPASNKILWLKTGPWLNQHDVNFIDSDRISLFGNNIVQANPDELLIDGHNEVYIYNFKTNTVETPYTAVLKAARVSTTTEGRANVLPNGDLFVEESNNNRLFRSDRNAIVWQYIDRVDQHSVAALSWSRFITKEEFKKLTFLQKSNTL
ncbi:MAG: Arylsulfotransferase [Mucilaginibacter sp.]|jgi:hypothetical protein|nr:Arylsulfotransferase [Mucilaginibacter sp.]